MKINDVMYLCVKKKYIFMYFLSYYKSYIIDITKNRANLPEIRGISSFSFTKTNLLKPLLFFTKNPHSLPYSKERN